MAKEILSEGSQNEVAAPQTSTPPETLPLEYNPVPFEPTHRIKVAYKFIGDIPPLPYPVKDYEIITD